MQFKKFLFLFLLSPVVVGCQKLDFSNIDFTQLCILILPLPCKAVKHPALQIPAAQRYFEKT